MQSISTGITNLIARLDSEKAKALKIAQNNKIFEEGVRLVWKDNPDAANYLLAHVNSIYIMKDETLRKSAYRGERVYSLTVCMDDSIAKSELNARRERLHMVLRQSGMHFHELRIQGATRDMKYRKLYPEALREVSRALYGIGEEGDAEEEFKPVPDEEINALCNTIDDPQVAEAFKKAISFSAGTLALRCCKGNGTAARGTVERSIYDQSKLLTAVKTAVVLAIGSCEQAEAVLGRVEGAALELVTFDECNERGAERYWCYFYVRDYRHMASILKAYERDIVSKARRLGVNLHSIGVRQSPDALKGERAFPKCGDPIPLIAYQIEWEKD